MDIRLLIEKRCSFCCGYAFGEEKVGRRGFLDISHKCQYKISSQSDGFLGAAIFYLVRGMILEKLSICRRCALFTTRYSLSIFGFTKANYLLLVSLLTPVPKKISEFDNRSPRKLY